MKNEWQKVNGFTSVQAFIDATFDASSFRIESIPLPQGKLIIDATGSSVSVWWDILEQCVCYNVEVA